VVSAYNHPFDLKLRGDARIERVLSEYSVPKLLPPRDSLSEDDALLFDALLAHFLLLRNEDASFFESGFVRQVPDPIGERLAIPDLAQVPPHSSCVFGVPFDLGSRVGGASQGTQAIRGSFRKHQKQILAARETQAHPFVYDFELRRRYDVSNMSVLDVGDIHHDPMSGAEGFALKTQCMVEALMRCGARPLILGGDHTITLFCLRGVAVRESQFGLVHFDAHHDLYLNTYSQRTTVNHGNFLAEALSLPSLKQVVNIGGRGIEYLTRYSAERRDCRVSWVSPMQLRRNSVSTLLAHMRTDIPWYVTFDVDVLDPSFARDTGSPVLGGISYLDAVELMDDVLRRVRVVGADFVEVTANAGRGLGLGAEVSARLVLQLVLDGSAFEEL
jgi:arginase family enzyme